MTTEKDADALYEELLLIEEETKSAVIIDDEFIKKYVDIETKVSPCWDGYEQIGMKKGKGGKMVPNCVPIGTKSLDEWFKEDWVDISRPKKGGGFEPCGRRDTDSGKYPKCVPAAKAAKMTPAEIASAVRRKRKAESTQTRVDKKPINVSTEKKDARFAIEEKTAIPTNPELYARVKAQAKKKFDVYPSAYANAWLVREYKKRGGGYRTSKKTLNDGELSQKGAKKPRLRDPKGGLTAAGRAHFRRTEGANLKPGVKGAADTPEKMRRKGSFLTRFFTNPSGPMKDEKGRPTRLALSARAWGEPVPQDRAAAARLAEKGRNLLERYENTKKKKDAWLESEEKMLGPTIGGSSQQDATRDQDDDGVINDGTPNEKPTPKNSDRAEDLRNSRKSPYRPGFILPDDGGNLQQYSGEPPKDKPYFKEHRNGNLYEFRPNRPPRKSRILGNDEII